MKLEILGEEHYLIFTIQNDFDLEDKNNLVGNLKNALISINNIYNLNLQGFYDLKVDTNQFGSFLELEKLDDFSNSLDLKTSIRKSPFLLEITNPSPDVNYYYNDKFYKKIESVKDLELGKIIYGKEVDYIIKNGHVVK